MTNNGVGFNLSLHVFFGEETSKLSNFAVKTIQIVNPAIHFKALH